MNSWKQKPTRHHGHMLDLFIQLIIMAVLGGAFFGGTLLYKRGIFPWWGPFFVLATAVAFGLVAVVFFTVLFFVGQLFGWVFEKVLGFLFVQQTNGDTEIFQEELDRTLKNPGFFTYIFHHGFLLCIPMSLLMSWMCLLAAPTSKAKFLTLELLIICVVLGQTLGVLLGIFNWVASRLIAPENLKEISYIDPFYLLFLATIPIGLWVQDSLTGTPAWVRSVGPMLAIAVVTIALFRIKRLRHRKTMRATQH